MIKTPFTIYYDIETYGKYLKNTKQHGKNQNTTHEQLLKPYLIGYILKNNYNDIYSKKCQIFTGERCKEKMILKTPFTIYYDIETYGKYLKNTKQHGKNQNTTHEQLLKPYLIGYIR